MKKDQEALRSKRKEQGSEEEMIKEIWNQISADE